MRVLPGMLVAGMLLGQVRAQETQAAPVPVEPVGQQQTVPAQTKTPSQPAAPIERRGTKPSATAVEPVAGPLTGAAAKAAAQGGVQAVNRDGEVGTIRVQSRLVNVAMNVVDAKGSPVGGFEKADFQLFEDGKPQTIAVFEREASSPLSIVLAIDASETVMTSERLEREAAKRFVRAILRPQDELDLMDFADTVREVVPFTNEPKRIETGLGELQHGEETALYDAIFLASDRLATTRTDAGRRRVIVIISDGGDSARHSRYAQAMEEAQRAGAMIYSIIIVPIAADAGRNTGGEHALIQMSEDTGGKYYYVVDPKDLEPAFRHVSDDLRTQYLLGYYSPEAGGNGFRRIKVVMADKGLAETYGLRYRSGYYADGK